jgi:farnesyl diphosphate synthase
MPNPLIPTAIAQAASAVTGDKAAKKKAARARFEGAWMRIRDELVAHLASEGMPKDATQWFERVRTHPH